MRLIVSSDLHGDVAAYRALLELAAERGGGAVVVSGDLLPHTAHVASAIATQRAFIHEQLAPLLRSFRSANPSTMIYLLAGNDDWAAAVADLAAIERDGLAIALHRRVVRLGDPTDDRWLAGLAYVPVTPFSIKDYERRDELAMPPHSFAMAYVSDGGAARPVSADELAARPSIADELADLARQSDPRRTVYVCHTPPHGTALDTMPRGRHVGSRALRAFIERHAPPLTLHGHIHESPALSGRFAERIGPTWSVNGGSDGIRLHAVVIDLDGDLRLEHIIYGLAEVS